MLIKLERFTNKEIPQLISWVENKEFLLQWAGPSYTMESLERQLEGDINMMQEEECRNLMYSAKLIESNEVVGHIQLLGIDRVNMSARIGRVLVGEKDNRGKGIDLEMIIAILDIAFNKFNLHRVDLGVFDFNETAIACYKKAGFIIEGSFRDYRKINGQYWALLNMSILEDEYRGLAGV